MFQRIQLVAAVWHVLVGGWIIFWNGKGWCIACREDTVLDVLGVVALVLGVVGLVGRFSSDPMPGRA